MEVICPGIIKVRPILENKTEKSLILSEFMSNVKQEPVSSRAEH